MGGGAWNGRSETRHANRHPAILGGGGCQGLQFEARRRPCRIAGFALVTAYHHRPGHGRVSPHFYNTEAEIDRFVEVLAGVSG